MAFNAASFATRTGSALIFACVMLLGLFLHAWSFYVLFLAIHIIAWKEYETLIAKIHPQYLYTHSLLRIMPVVMGCGLILLCIQSSHALFIQNFGMGMLLSAIIVWLSCLLKEKSYRKILVKYNLFGLFYLSLPLGLLLNIRSSFSPSLQFFAIDDGLKYVFTLLVSIWINDSMQYMVGSLIGKIPFSKISPNKTWEGTLGGILLCISIVTLLGMATHFLPMYVLLFISAIAGICGTFGDLLESKIKRMAGVKDSGNILPGHGGILDRFDSFIFSVPFVWLFIYISQRAGQF